MRALKITALLMAALICLCSCGSSSGSSAGGSQPVQQQAATEAPFGGITPKEEAFAGNGDYDVDLTGLSSTMVYAQVSDMMTNPDSYKGKSVRAKGTFSYFKDDATGKEYFAVLVQDATACCAQGIEFVLKGDYKYPDDYPEQDTEITVSGKFDCYTEGEYSYIQLLDADMKL